MGKGPEDGICDSISKADTDPSIRIRDHLNNVPERSWIHIRRRPNLGFWIQPASGWATISRITGIDKDPGLDPG